MGKGHILKASLQLGGQVAPCSLQEAREEAGPSGRGLSRSEQTQLLKAGSLRQKTQAFLVWDPPALSSPLGQASSPIFQL